MRQHAVDGCAFAGFVGNPKQWIVCIVITTWSQTAFIFQWTPATVGVFGAQTWCACRVHRTIVHFNFWHAILGHHIQIQFLQIEMHVCIHGWVRMNLDIGILNGGRRRFNDDLLQMTIGRANEYDGVAAGACGCDCRQSRLEQCNRHCSNGLFSAQRIVDVKAAKVFADCLQFRRNALHIRRYEVQSTRSMPIETWLNVLHKFPANWFQRVHTQCRSIRGHIPFAFGENSVQNIILRCDGQILGQIGARFAQIGGLHQIVFGRFADAVNGNFGVRVIVWVLLADAHQFRDVLFGRWSIVLQLCGEKVWKTFRTETVHIVDDVRFTWIRIDVDAGAGGDSRCGQLKHTTLFQATRCYRRYFTAIQWIACKCDAHIHDVRGWRWWRTGRDKCYRRCSWKYVQKKWCLWIKKSTSPNVNCFLFALTFIVGNHSVQHFLFNVTDIL